MNIVNSIKTTYSGIIGNAVSVRDYRVQLRGNRPLILWGAYLVILIGIGITFYWQTKLQAGDDVSVVTLQYKLYQYYQSLFALLVGLIIVIAPGLTAGSIATERERQSLDLIISAPAPPKYLLIGKMIASYRYIVMLLVLSLPVTSTCVVLGGASWSDVFSAYINVSANALIYCGIGLIASAKASKVRAALLCAYVFSVLYALVTAALIAEAIYMPPTSLPGHPVISKPWSGMNPFAGIFVAGAETVVFGLVVPIWHVTIVMCTIIARLMAMSAACAISPVGSHAIKAYRLNCLTMQFVSGLAINSWLQSDHWMTLHVSSVAIPFLLLGASIPGLACFVNTDESGCRNDGLFKIRNMLSGNISGNLPFIVTMWAAGMLGFLISGSGIVLKLVAGFWVLGVLFFCWGTGRWISTLFFHSRRPISPVHVVHWILLILICVWPLPLAAIFDLSIDPKMSWLWNLFPLAALDSSASVKLALSHGAAFLVIGALLLYDSIRRSRDIWTF